MDSSKFSGSVTITVQVNEPTSTVILHAMDMEIAQATVLAADSTVVARVTEIAYDAGAETATIKLPVELRPGRVHLIIEYAGVLGDSMYGMYRCRYRDRSGQQSYMIVTQFQAKCARLAFPCWDEPAIKAEFALSLTV
ncbi:hypothetical protein EC988_010254, partial [Linderina pennispora]